MDFEWDERKSILNLNKHGVDFADTIAVFEDEQSVTIPDDESEEPRFITLGIDTLGRLLVVVYTWRQDRIRIISARKASRRERQQYEGAV